MYSEDAPSLDKLDADIKLISEVLADAVAELSGEDTLQMVRDLRDAAVALRNGEFPGGRDAFAKRICGCSDAELELVARVFTQWFHLVNSSEQQHRLRVLRSRDRKGHAPADSVVDACLQLRDAGVQAGEVRSLLSRLFVMPVLTAHPTEARRRTVLDHLGNISECLDKLDREQLGDREREGVVNTLRSTVLALYASEESRSRKPTPNDEVRAGLDVFERTLLDVTPTIYRELERGLAAAYPGESFSLPVFLSWGTWIGGDRDGNPHVTSSITRSAMERQRVLVLNRYLSDVNALARSLSISSRRIINRRAVEVLEESMKRDRLQMPDLAARAERYSSYEPWREKLSYVKARLRATLDRADGFYTDPAEYVEDLRVIEQTLSEAGFARLAEKLVRDSRCRAEVFGFHLASLDLRQHSGVHERAVAELLRAVGRHGYLDMAEKDRAALLEEVLESPNLEGIVELSRSTLGKEAQEILATLDMVGRARREQGARACERYIVSFTNAPSDLLEVLILVRAARLSPGELRPVPLLEQLEDLQHAGEIAQRMLQSKAIRAALHDELEVMIGYSDAGKQIGYLAAAFALRKAQITLASVADREQVKLTIFHGRGGTIGRGGGPSNRTIRAQPPQALRGRLRITEQGETVTVRYGRAEIARRDLEQMMHAVLVASIEERDVSDSNERDAMLDRAAAGAQETYAKLLENKSQLAQYALSATPIQQVAQLPIGSRPASRRPGFSFEDLRAIPWVFSWNQSRHGLPGWFGLGTALDVIVQESGIEGARQLYCDWSFFRGLINNAQLALTRTDIDVAEHYSRLAESQPRAIFSLIAEEHKRTVRRVLEVVDRQTLLGNRPHLVTTVQRRNPYVDVLSHTQIELLRRLASCEENQRRTQILESLFITINGIAAGLQTAG